MTQQAYAVQAHSAPSTPALHFPDVARGVSLLFGAAMLAKYTLLNEHVIFGPVAWIVFLVSVAITIAAAVRLVLVDAAAAPERSQRVERTRRVGVLKELLIAGPGALLLVAPAAYLILTTSQEMWAGRVQEGSSPEMVGVLSCAMFGAAGFLMTFFRPQFVLDAARGTITRYAFGRSIPLRVKQLRYSDLVVYSEGYWITNTAQRLGDIVRGRVGKYTFELEMIRGNLPAATVEARAMSWASALGAKYQTPEQTVAAELA